MTAAAFVLVEDTDTSTDHKSLLLGQAWETGSLAPSRQDCLTAHQCSPSPFPNHLQGHSCRDKEDGFKL